MESDSHIRYIKVLQPGLWDMLLIMQRRMPRGGRLKKRRAPGGWDAVKQISDAGDADEKLATARFLCVILGWEGKSGCARESKLKQKLQDLPFTTQLRRANIICRKKVIAMWSCGEMGKTLIAFSPNWPSPKVEEKINKLKQPKSGKRSQLNTISHGVVTAQKLMFLIFKFKSGTRTGLWLLSVSSWQ